MRVLAVLAGLLLAWTSAARADGPDAGADAAASPAWRRALALWEARDPGAYAAWESMPVDTSEGRQAHRRLRDADALYRGAIARYAARDPDATLEAPLSLAPIDPQLYLPLARAVRGHDPVSDARAATYYLRYLAVAPDDLTFRAARAELRALDLGGSPDYAASVALAADALAESRGRVRPAAPTVIARPAGTPAVALIAIGVAAGLALAALLAFSQRLLAPRGRSLARLCRDAPELHPAVAYLVASLRHELLKHRIGAIGDAVAAVSRGDATPSQREFLANRLYGGEPLAESWEGHVSAFERTLGQRVDLRRRDAEFRHAAKAIVRIVALERGVREGDRAAGGRLAKAHATLRAFDASLAKLAAGLVRARLDEPLLREVIASVSAEHSAGGVPLDEVTVEAAGGAVDVEVFRVDLVLVLKNLVRNAILAMADEQAGHRRLALLADVELLPTGDEAVRVRVRDTSRRELTTGMIRERRVDRGLGLVRAALARYDAVIAVEPAPAPFTKSVTVRFFRALSGEE